MVYRPALRSARCTCPPPRRHCRRCRFGSCVRACLCCCLHSQPPPPSGDEGRDDVAIATRPEPGRIVLRPERVAEHFLKGIEAGRFSGRRCGRCTRRALRTARFRRALEPGILGCRFSDRCDLHVHRRCVRCHRCHAGGSHGCYGGPRGEWGQPRPVGARKVQRGFAGRLPMRAPGDREVFGRRVGDGRVMLRWLWFRR